MNADFNRKIGALFVTATLLVASCGKHTGTTAGGTPAEAPPAASAAGTNEKAPVQEVQPSHVRDVEETKRPTRILATFKAYWQPPDAPTGSDALRRQMCEALISDADVTVRSIDPAGPSPRTTWFLDIEHITESRSAWNTWRADFYGPALFFTEKAPCDKFMVVLDQALKDWSAKYREAVPIQKYRGMWTEGADSTAQVNRSPGNQPTPKATVPILNPLHWNSPSTSDLPGVWETTARDAAGKPLKRLSVFSDLNYELVSGGVLDTGYMLGDLGSIRMDSATTHTSTNSTFKYKGGNVIETAGALGRFEWVRVAATARRGP